VYMPAEEYWILCCAWQATSTQGYYKKSYIYATPNLIAALLTGEEEGDKPVEG
jgi:hypothetical protein